MPRISVIVPVYNAEKYLCRCIDSILAQTFTDFELLLVDDGSTDKSGVICDEYAAKDARIRIFHKQNGGVSSARNLGILNSCGEFIQFADADDLLPENCLELHVNNLSDNVTMTMGGFCTIEADGSLLCGPTPARKETKSHYDALRDCFPTNDGPWQKYLWNRMMRSEEIRKNGITFNESIHYKEDGLFVIQYLARSAGDVAYIDRSVYLYRRNSEGAMENAKTVRCPKLLTNLDAHRLILKELLKQDIPEDIAESAVNGAFAGRIWVMETLRSVGALNKRIWLSSIIDIYRTIGFKKSVKHFVNHFRANGK